jgi:hypothetical protein
MNNITLSRDSAGFPIQEVFTPKLYSRLILGSASVRTSSDFTYPIIQIASTANCFIELGGSTIVADGESMFLPSNTIMYVKADEANVRLAAVSSGEAMGYLSIVEMG